MNGALQLKLSLLRGESPCPMDLADFGRLAAIDLRTQTKSVRSDRLAVAMLGMIASGRLPPGARLPPERRIAEAASASRVCVRSALNRLKLDGYIEAVQGSGTRVVALERSERLIPLIRANQENLEDLQDFIAFLDRCVVEQLVRRAPAAVLGRAAERLAVAPAGPDVQARAEDELHVRLALSDASGSPIYAMITRQLARGIRSLFGSLLGAAGETGFDRLARDRRALACAVAERNAAAAEAALARRDAVLRGLDWTSMASGEGAPREEAILRDLAVASPEQLKDRLTREIAGMIATGHARDGARLLSERRLATVFGVSRASVREALAALKAEGTVVADERCGTRAVDAPAALTSLAAADLDHLQTMSRLRGYLEVWAASRAAERGSERDFADLRRILAEMGRSHLSARRRIDLDLRLHLTIARAAGSAVHLYITEVLRDLMTAYFDYSLTAPSIGGGRDAMLLRHHTQIVTAILARDTVGAGRAMAEHCGAFSDRYAMLDADREMLPCGLAADLAPAGAAGLPPAG
ncbi:HTH-type transcriptional repressor NanR [Methylobacterium crusticola]|uniref:HTH-type transcriptional repressor NanR n=1 Tax=Methylobacterium crusticola TaxID=1697972 RepID=A0ABQ4QXF2_9HYPH|nr:GntR family transcriptional regulator [Methylobacterium crusticola]GJD49736.1 HTH-type transcriptional repressor NanR [Methylobacterium crusticola]